MAEVVAAAVSGSLGCLIEAATGAFDSADAMDASVTNSAAMAVDACCKATHLVSVRAYVRGAVWPRASSRERWHGAWVPRHNGAQARDIAGDFCVNAGARAREGARGSEMVREGTRGCERAPSACAQCLPVHGKCNLHCVHSYGHLRFRVIPDRECAVCTS